MISTIHIENFQCHRNLTIDLDPCVTVLTGTNGAGKSAIIRALRWWALNEWQGKADQMIHWDADRATVTGTVDGNFITREKGKKGNLYTLNGDELEAVGAGKVPEPIAKIINLTEENFQEQHDPAFWFNLTAGQVAKSLNKIVNLSTIDTSLENVAAELRQAKETVRVTEQRISEAASLKESLSFVLAQDQKLKELEALEVQMDEIGSRRAVLESIVTKAREQSIIKQNAAKAIQSGSEALEAMQKVSTISNNIQKIRGLAYQVETQERKTCEIKAKLVKAQGKLETMSGLLCRRCQGVGLEPLKSSASL